MTTSETRAYDMSRYQRLIAVENGRVTGTFKASWSLRHRPEEVLIHPVDVTVWDEHRHSGRVLHSGDDLTAWVRSGEVEIPEHMIREAVKFDVLDAIDEMKLALRLVAEKAIEVMREGQDDHE